jgi:hypothetical protein
MRVILPWRWLAGLPFAVIGLLPALSVGQEAAFAGLAAAILGMYAAFIPMTARAVLERHATFHELEPGMTRAGYLLLLALWLLTDLAGVLLHWMAAG